jgi:hypothetical protein
MFIRCDRCFGNTEVGEHGLWKCPLEARHAGPTVIPDDVPGGFTVENMGHEPLTFHSKSEWKRDMKARGLVNQVRHVGVQGSDKSPHTTRWV